MIAEEESGTGGTGRWSVRHKLAIAGLATEVKACENKAEISPMDMSRGSMSSLSPAIAAIGYMIRPACRGE